MNDLCSVVVPTRNRRELLLRTLKTIQRQTYDSLEIVVSDDGSTDGSEQAVAALEDPRIVFVTGGDASGAAETRNRGIARCTGKWIAVCDDDDLWSKDKLLRQIYAMERDRTRWSYTHTLRVDSSLRFIGREGCPIDHQLDTALRSFNWIPGGCSSVVFDRSLVSEVGAFDSSFSMFADWELWIRFAGAGEPSRITDPCVLYVVHAGQMTRSMDNAAAELQLLRSKHAVVARGSDDLMDRWIVERMWRAGNRRGALTSALARGVRSLPAHAKTVLLSYWDERTSPLRAKANDGLILATVDIWPDVSLGGARRRSSELAVLTDVRGAVA